MPRPRAQITKGAELQRGYRLEEEIARYGSLSDAELEDKIAVVDRRMVEDIRRMTALNTERRRRKARRRTG